MRLSARPSLVPVRSAAVAAVAALGLTLLPPAPAQADAAPRAIDTSRLDTALAGLQQAGGVGVVARVTSGKRQWSRAVGTAAPGTPATTDARFRAGSVSKQVIATLVLQLVEEGVWTLDTRVGSLLPGLLPGKGRVALRQLLNHTSGMPEFLLTVLADATSEQAFLDAISTPRTDRQLVRAALQQPWQFRPGTDWGYSNTNYVVAGMMLEKAIGLPVKRLVRDRVARPLRLRDFTMAGSPGLRPPALQETVSLEGQSVSTASFDPTLFSSAGSLVTTTRDLDRFEEALNDGDLLSRRSTRWMRSVQVPEGAAAIRYGLGSYRLPDPCRPGQWLHGHDGGTYGTLTVAFSSGDGRTRVVAAMTGRRLDATSSDAIALLDFVGTAVAATCGAPSPARSGGAGAGAGATPAAVVDHLRERTAAAYAR